MKTDDRKIEIMAYMEFLKILANAKPNSDGLYCLDLIPMPATPNVFITIKKW